MVYMNLDKKAIGNRIKDFRERELDVSQPEFASRFGVPQPKLSMVENAQIVRKSTIEQFVRQITGDDEDLFRRLMYGEQQAGDETVLSQRPQEVSMRNRRNMPGFGEEESKLPTLTRIMMYCETNQEAAKVLAKLIEEDKLDAMIELAKKFDKTESA